MAVMIRLLLCVHTMIILKLVNLEKSYAHIVELRFYQATVNTNEWKCIVLGIHNY